MRSIALSVLVMSILGCSGSVEPHRFRTALPQEFDPPVPVILSDETGLVSGVEPMTDPQGGTAVPVILPDASDSNAFFVTWLGGPCEAEVALSFTSQEGGYLLQLAVRPTTGGCPLIGIPRGVRITTSPAIPMSSIAVTGRG